MSRTNSRNCRKYRWHHFAVQQFCWRLVRNWLCF